MDDSRGKEIRVNYIFENNLSSKFHQILRVQVGYIPLIKLATMQKHVIVNYNRVNVVKHTKMVYGLTCGRATTILAFPSPL